MIDKGVTSADIAAGTGLDKRYVASVIYGRVDSPRARKKISDFLGISDSEYPDD
jgi:cyanate lyase